jgi:hypothetical protein
MLTRMGGINYAQNYECKSASESVDVIGSEHWQGSVELRKMKL